MEYVLVDSGRRLTHGWSASAANGPGAIELQVPRWQTARDDGDASSHEAGWRGQCRLLRNRRSRGPVILTCIAG